MAAKYLKLLLVAINFIFLPQAFPQELTGKVISVKDGDTIEILVNDKPIRIRLNGIDCPEKNQPFGQRAKQFTSDLVFGKVARVVIKDTDRYGRKVGDVYIHEGKLLNYELVKAGLAWWYRQYSHDPNLQKLENEARSKKQGLWSDSNRIPPWEFRHGTPNKERYKPESDKNYQQCKAITKSGKRCSRKADKSGYCWQHKH